MSFKSYYPKVLAFIFIFQFIVFVIFSISKKRLFIYLLVIFSDFAIRNSLVFWLFESNIRQQRDSVFNASIY